MIMFLGFREGCLFWLGSGYRWFYSVFVIEILCCYYGGELSRGSGFGEVMYWVKVL